MAEAAEKSLPRRPGLRVSASTVERATEAEGRRLASSQPFGVLQPWAWHNIAEGQAGAYVLADVTGVGT